MDEVKSRQSPEEGKGKRAFPFIFFKRSFQQFYFDSTFKSGSASCGSIDILSRCLSTKCVVISALCLLPSLPHKRHRDLLDTLSPQSTASSTALRSRSLAAASSSARCLTRCCLALGREQESRVRGEPDGQRRQIRGPGTASVEGSEGGSEAARRKDSRERRREVSSREVGEKRRSNRCCVGGGWEKVGEQRKKSVSD